MLDSLIFFSTCLHKKQKVSRYKNRHHAHKLHQSTPGLNNSVRNSGVNSEIIYGAGKAQAEIAACHATQICTKIQTGYRLAPFKFYILLRNSECKNHGKTRSRCRATDYFTISPCVPGKGALHLQDFLNTPAPDLTLPHCYM